MKSKHLSLYTFTTVKFHYAEMKRKGARSKAVAKSSVAQQEEHVQVELQRDNNYENEGDEGGGFFACYLLTSLSPRFKGHTYIGLGFFSHLRKICFLSSF